MQAVRQLGTAILLSVVSLGLVVGGFSLALYDSYAPPLPTPTGSLPTAPVLLTITSTAPVPPTTTNFPTPTSTPQPAPFCNPPTGWISVSVQTGDTLASVAYRYGTTPVQLSQANCLLTDALLPGTTLFVPPIPTNTPIPCGPPYGWVYYIVQPGDTLFHIAFSYGITTYQLQLANCLGYSTYIRVGQTLWAPNIPTITPGVTVIPVFPTITLYPTEPLTLTPLPFTQTPAATDTSIPTLQSSPTAFPPMETDTPIPTLEASPTPFPTASETPIPTVSETPVPPTPTVTAFPTNTP